MLTEEELRVLRVWLKRMTGRCPVTESRMVKALIERHEMRPCAHGKSDCSIPHTDTQ